MPARTGNEYIEGLRDRPREVWIRGERVDDIPSHPVFRNCVRTVASLYDMQHEAKLKKEMTFPSPTTGDPVGVSFLIPRSTEDLMRRRKMMARWAIATCGMMARTPDLLNVGITAWAGAADYFGQNRPEFKENVRRFHEHIRENDVALTHTLVNLQQRRSPSLIDPLSDEVALTVVRETDAGLILRGSRILATFGPLADEMVVYPTRSHLIGEDAWRQAFFFAVPCDAPGLTFLCRESFDLDRSHFDHPLGSRFEEMDAIVFFDDVLVPWERVFLVGDVDMCNNYGGATNASAHVGHHMMTRTVAKTEFVLGLTSLMVETLGSGKVPHVQERVGEIIDYLEVLRACLRAAEADASIDRWGVMSPLPAPLASGRSLFARTIYPRMAEIVQLLGSSSLMALPNEADFDSLVAPEVNRYLATDTATARERARLFHLAWDVACSAFGGRQLLYERFFSGDPVRTAILLYNSYDKAPYMARVRDFLQRED